ncbi:hypothetical protein [Myroides sp. DF42-4-2]|uniref:hypothetical protein n=1 Tax=Myroides sp. DF42-4-2 TaxID=2746726 RepID=UPI00257555C8|nr:hypothetical protein [Myroides sp. DF42-4-2]MDM1407429.1 hypothetical protein [Myroides sp. DF42-4-2]
MIKKIYLVVAIGIMAVGTLACSGDDNNSRPINPNYQETIQGTWQKSKIFYLDKNRKVIGQVAAPDHEGCGVDKRVYAKGSVTNIFSYKNHAATCVTERLQEEFDIVGNKINYTYADGDMLVVFQEEIISMQAKKMVVLDLNIQTEAAVEKQGWPKGTTFIQFELTKK